MGRQYQCLQPLMGRQCQCLQLLMEYQRLQLPMEYQCLQLLMGHQDQHKAAKQALKTQAKQDKNDLKQRTKDLQSSTSTPTTTSTTSSSSSSHTNTTGNGNGTNEFKSDFKQHATNLKEELSYQTKFAVNVVKQEYEKFEKGVQMRYNNSAFGSGLGQLSQGQKQLSAQGQQQGHVYNNPSSSSLPVTDISTNNAHPTSPPQQQQQQLQLQQHYQSQQQQLQQIQLNRQLQLQNLNLQKSDLKAQKRLNKQIYRDQKQLLRQQRRLEKSIARENKHGGPVALPIRLIGLGPRLVGGVVGGMMSDITRLVTQTGNNNGNGIGNGGVDRPQILVAPEPLSQPAYPPQQQQQLPQQQQPQHLQQQYRPQQQPQHQYYQAGAPISQSHYASPQPTTMPSAPPPPPPSTAPTSPPPQAAYRPLTKDEKEIGSPDPLIAYRMAGLSFSPSSSSGSSAPPMPAPSAPPLVSMTSPPHRPELESTAVAEDDSVAPPPYEAAYSRA
ncbi:hypothetical protein BGZ96_011365 [Linnemannia gamsii]|uniref:Uncharacterized protein n=1 Tax=Linnemannia gamsii TaxID=64522 RepID=A0ABQ7JT00_9FUNG|nr:hypothetical protein BGZ96_011365 [Linnemannia gamsii]